MTTPDYDYDLAKNRMRREEMMAAMAQQLAMGPSMNGTATSPLHVLASMLAAYASNKRLDSADRMRSEYSTNLNMGHMKDMLEFNELMKTRGRAAAVEAMRGRTNPLTRNLMAEHEKFLARGEVMPKDLAQKADPRTVQANPTDPSSWTMLPPTGTVGGVLYDKTTNKPIQLDMPAGANDPISIGPDLYKRNPTTGGLSQLNKAPRINTTVINANKGETQFEKTFGADQARKFSDALEARPKMIDGIQSIDSALGLLDKGIHSGIYANVTKNIEKFGAPFAGAPAEKAANTEHFIALVGDNVLARLKDFGGSDTVEEMRYLEKIQAGDITLEPQALRRILTKVRTYMARKVEEVDQVAEHYKAQGYPIIPTMGEHTRTPLPNPSTGTKENPMTLEDYARKYLGR